MEGNAGHPSPRANIDALVAACFAEADAKGIDPSELSFVSPYPVHEPSAAERIAEHTGHNEWVKVERFVTYLANTSGTRLTSGEQAYLAAIITGQA